MIYIYISIYVNIYTYISPYIIPSGALVEPYVSYPQNQDCHTCKALSSLTSPQRLHNASKTSPQPPAMLRRAVAGRRVERPIDNIMTFIS